MQHVANRKLQAEVQEWMEYTLELSYGLLQDSGATYTIWQCFAAIPSSLIVLFLISQYMFLWTIFQGCEVHVGWGNPARKSVPS